MNPGVFASRALPWLSAVYCIWTWASLPRSQISTLTSTITLLCIRMTFKQLQIEEPWNVDYAVCKTAFPPKKKLPYRQSKHFKIGNNIILLKFKLFYHTDLVFQSNVTNRHRSKELSFLYVNNCGVPRTVAQFIGNSPALLSLSSDPEKGRNKSQVKFFFFRDWHCTSQERHSPWDSTSGKSSGLPPYLL